MACPNCGRKSDTPSIECCSFECWEKLYAKKVQAPECNDDSLILDFKEMSAALTRI